MKVLVTEKQRDNLTSKEIIVFKIGNGSIFQRAQKDLRLNGGDEAAADAPESLLKMSKKICSQKCRDCELR